MRKRLLALLMIPAVLLLLSACSKSGTPPAPAKSITPAPTQPAPAASAPTPDPPAAQTPGVSSLTEEVPFADAGKVRAAIAAPSPVHYRVVNVAAPAGTDEDKYLDDYLAREGAPGQNELLLLIFPRSGSDIRFAMGAIFREKKVTVAELLTMIRTKYLPAAKAGQPEEGIVALTQAVNDRMK